MFSGSSIPIESLRTAEDLLISKMAAKKLKIATKKFKMSAPNHINIIKTWNEKLLVAQF